MLKRIHDFFNYATWNRYTDRARAAMVLANQKAHESRSPLITQDHLLAAIAEKHDGVGAAVLRYVNIRLIELVPQHVTMPPISKSSAGDLLKLPMDGILKETQRRAIDEAIALGDNYVGTEHLVLALARGSCPLLARQMTSAKLTPDHLRNALQALIHLRHAHDALQAGNHREAAYHYRRTMIFSPHDHLAANNLAWILATSPMDDLRSGKEALQLMQWVIGGSELAASYNLGTVAAAYAETGQFELATSFGLRAQQIAADPYRERWQHWLAGFAQHQPVRESLPEKILP